MIHFLVLLLGFTINHLVHKFCNLFILNSEFTKKYIYNMFEEILNSMSVSFLLVEYRTEIQYLRRVKKKTRIASYLVC